MVRNILLGINAVFAIALGSAGCLAEDFFLPADSLCAPNAKSDALSLERLAYLELCERRLEQARGLANQAKMGQHTELCELVLAECLRQDGKSKEALVLLESLPADSSFADEIAIMKAFVWLSMKDYERVIRSDLDAGRITALALAKSLAFCGVQQYEKALEQARQYKKLHSRGPQHVPELPFLCFGLAHAGLNEFELAIESFRSGIDINPKSVALNYQYSRLLLQLGRIVEAREVVSKLNEFAPQRMETAHVSAELYYKTRTFSKAIEFLERLYAIDESNSSVVLHLAYSYAGVGKVGRARILLDEHLRKNAVSESLELASKVLTAMDDNAMPKDLDDALKFLAEYGKKKLAPVQNRVQCAALLTKHREYEAARAVLEMIDSEKQPADLRLEIDRVTFAIESKAPVLVDVVP